jgi:hypothetical protein
MMNAVPTVSNEAKMYKIMGDLKLSNQHREMLHKNISVAIDAIEASILANPTVEEFKTLLLRTLAIHGRDKTVCSYEFKVVVYEEIKEGVKGLVDKWKAGFYQEDIDEHDWRVSIVKGGTKVRVHMTETAMARVKAEWAERAKHGGHRKIVFYE